MRVTLSSAALLVLSMGVLICANFVHAEMTQDQMHATIMAALLSDPRTSSVPPAQLQALVNVLAEEASTQGLNAQDIKWQTAAVAASFGDAREQKQAQCMGIFPGLCPFSDAFGFTGNDAAVPLILFGTSGLLLFLLYEIIRHHRKKLDAEKMISSQSGESASTPAPSEAAIPPAMPQ